MSEHTNIDRPRPLPQHRGTASGGALLPGEAKSPKNGGRRPGESLESWEARACYTQAQKEQEAAKGVVASARKAFGKAAEVREALTGAQRAEVVEILREIMKLKAPEFLNSEDEALKKRAEDELAAAQKKYSEHPVTKAEVAFVKAMGTLDDARRHLSAATGKLIINEGETKTVWAQRVHVNMDLVRVKAAEHKQRSIEVQRIAKECRDARAAEAAAKKEKRDKARAEAAAKEAARKKQGQPAPAAE